MIHFALRDLAESALALVMFLPLTFAPGYLFAWAGDIGGFRSASLVERLAWSVPLSLGLGTMLMVWGGSLGGLWLDVGLYAALAIGVIALIVWEVRESRLVLSDFFSDRYTKLALLAVGLWCVAALLQLVDLQWGHSLLVSVTVRDHSYRTAFIEAVLRSGVPPTNPLYFTGHPALMRNYYFWYVVCAVVCKATLLSARDVLVASCTWAAIGAFCAAALFCKYFLAPRTGLRRTALISILLFWVTGLDLIMVAYLHTTPIHRFDGDMEWWDVDHFPSFLDNFLYVPHHVASLVCCMASLVVLWVARNATRRSQRWFAIVFSAIAFTSAFGLSIYVAFAYAVTILIWLIWLALEHQRRLIGMICWAGGIAAILILPFAWQLRSDTTASAGKQSFPLTVRLRNIYGLDAWADALTRHTSHFYAAHIKIVRTVLWLILVTPDLTLELGFYGLCGVLGWWLMRRGHLASEPGTRALIVLAGAGMVATITIRSSITTVDDYGFRSAMIPLFLFLVLGARFVSEGLLSPRRQKNTTGSNLRFGKPLRWTALLFLVLGASATVYQALGIRFYLTLYEHNRLRDHRTNAAFPEMGQHVYQLREAYEQLNRIAPASAKVQYDPVTIGTYFVWINMLNVGHQIVTAEPGCGKSFGGDVEDCPVIEEAADSLYTDPAPNGATALQVCHDLGIDYLVATDQDPAWQDSASWVWSENAIIKEPEIRIIRCR